MLLVKKTESIDESIKQIVEAVEDGGVQIIIKGVDLPEEVKELFEKINDILNHDNGESPSVEAALPGVGTSAAVAPPNMEDVFGEMNNYADEDLLQSISDTIMEEP